jgi:hypothetical protein
MGGISRAIFGGGSAPSLPPAPIYDNSAEVAAAAAAERKRAAAARGRASTIRTGGAGVEEEPMSLLQLAGSKTKLGQ